MIYSVLILIPSKQKLTYSSTGNEGTLTSPLSFLAVREIGRSYAQYAPTVCVHKQVPEGYTIVEVWADL